MDGFLPGEQERFKMDIDMAAEVDAMYRIDIDLLPEWYPKFDP